MDTEDMDYEEICVVIIKQWSVLIVLNGNSLRNWFVVLVKFYDFESKIQLSALTCLLRRTPLNIFMYIFLCVIFMVISVSLSLSIIVYYLFYVSSRALKSLKVHNSLLSSLTVTFVSGVASWGVRSCHYFSFIAIICLTD